MYILPTRRIARRERIVAATAIALPTGKAKVFKIVLPAHTFRLHVFKRPITR